MKRREELILLHRWPYGETSWVLRALGRESGVVSLVAKGARRPKSRVSGALEPCSLSEVVWSAREGAELGTLVGATLLQGWPSVRADLLRSATAMALCEFPLRFRPEGEGNAPWFDHLLAGLRWLDGRTEFTPAASAAVLARFALRLAEECGVGLSLSRCAKCGAELERAALFVGSAGGFYCGGCAWESDPSAETLRLLAMGKTPEAGLDELERAEARAVDHLSAGLDIPLKLGALEFLKGLRRGR